MELVFYFLTLDMSNLVFPLLILLTWLVILRKGVKKKSTRSVKTMGINMLQDAFGQ